MGKGYSARREEGLFRAGLASELAAICIDPTAVTFKSFPTFFSPDWRDTADGLSSATFEVPGAPGVFVAVRDKDGNFEVAQSSDGMTLAADRITLAGDVRWGKN